MYRRQWWDDVRQDLKFALRQLRRAPAFAAVTVGTLGIAIGANAAVFSVTDAVLLNPLPYPESDQLSVVWTRYLPPSGFDIDKFALSGPEALDIVEEARSFESVGIFQTGSRALTGDDSEAERVQVSFFSVDVFPTLAVAPHLGRWFTLEEDAPDGPDVVVLSHALWTRRYGADPSIVGRTILMNGVSTEVVGVMPEGFSMPRGTDAWLPLGLTRESAGGRAGHGYSMVARRPSGLTQADADAELAVMADRWAAEYEHNVAHHPWSQRLYTEVVADAPRTLTLLLWSVALVLLVACANVANLLLARGERRYREVSLRTMLGAGRDRIARQLATESVVLAGVAALLGIAIAWASLRGLVALHPDALPRIEEVGLNRSVLGFTAAVAVATALLFGIGPALLAGRRATVSTTRSTRGSSGKGARALRRALVTGEVAVCLVVVILAGLIGRSFLALASTDPRMDPNDVLAFSVTLPSASYEDADRLHLDFERMLDEVRSLPGVTAASASTNLPLQGTGQWDFELNDRPARGDGDVAWNAGISQVGTDYFATMGIPVLAGRAFSAEDSRDGALVAVVSETMASRFWPDRSPIGATFGYEMAEDSVPWMTIIGVVPDPVTARLDRDPYPHVYVPISQGGISTYFAPRTLQIAVRSAVGTDRIIPAVREAMVDFDPDLPLYRVTTMEEIVSQSLASPRVTTNLLGAFAMIALLLAAVGIYGVISYSVAGRTREIGVRVALGAERTEITRLVLREGAAPVALGIALGLGGAWTATSLVQSMLFGIEATDPLTFVTLPLALLAVGIVASLVPARRATRIPPTEALRYD